MTDKQDLASLTLKDLRQLAGEQKIKNRSRLAKQELIDALQSLTAQKQDADPADAPAKTSSKKKAATTETAKSETKRTRRKSSKAAEPEVLTPADVSPEPEVLSPETIAAPKPAKASRPDKADKADKAERADQAQGRDRSQNTEDGQAKPERRSRKAQAGNTDNPDAAEAQQEADSSEADAEGDDAENGDGSGRKRRRRRRRRRRRDDENGDSADNGDNGDAAEANGDNRDSSDEAARPERPGKAERSGSKADKSERDDSASEDNRSRRRNGDRGAERSAERGENSEGERRQAQKNEAPEGERRQAQQRGARKPRLEGKQQPVASVLDRLKEFTAGILELCDPDTPSWAQARLSELLAATGVVPTPCTGEPHHKFHEIVGQTATTAIPRGHIAVIDAPGFSLRGDRGDLFPLRRAKVRIAGPTDADLGKPRTDRLSEQADEPASPTSDSPLDPVSDSPLDPVSDSPLDPVSANPVDLVSESPLEPAYTPAPEATDPEATDPKATDKAEREADSDNEGKGKRRRRGRRSTREPETSGPVLDEPEPRSTPRTTRVVAADESPSLPLQMQDAAELADRGKAAGFAHLNLNDQILADLHSLNWDKPSPIQDAAIPVAMRGVDMIGQAQTGTGKTAAFTLPVLHRLYEWEGQGPVALVLCPTRELARQVDAEFLRLAGQSGARSALVYGGVSMDDQFEALARHPHVVIGTPGRIIDHIKRRTLDLSRLKVAIMDEADQMLDIGFLPDVEYIIKHTPPGRQTLLFSATMPDEIKRLAEQYMKEPEHVHVMPERVTADKVDQKYIAVDANKKTELLAHFIETFEPEQLVVFCRTKHQTDRVAQVLKRKKLSAQAIHGDLPQNKRERTLQAFRDGNLPCLIATNVAARGLDIPSVSHVVNYDIPENPEEYVHRIGRTARMGKKGIARTFVTPEDGQFVVEIEKHIGQLLEEEVVEGITATTTTEVKRQIADLDLKGPRLLKPIAGGIRLGRRRR